MAKTPILRPSQVKSFQAQIWAFYEESGRYNLPWRKTRDPYKILVSEVMLQQTQVSRVLLKYPEFLKKFPTIEALANASLTQVLSEWQGMGYSRRARYLRESAKIILLSHKGVVPKTEVLLRALPGVGHYTANAVLAFALNQPRVFIETNIRRIYIHHFFQNRADVADAEILPLVEATLDRNSPREWYYALMDYGSHLPKVVRKNSNIQSKHYTKQSKFKGSVRELRGIIIKSLVVEPKTVQYLKNVCSNDVRTKEALDALVKDKLVSYEKRKYKLA